MQLQINNELKNNFLFETKEVRTILRGSEVWFVAKDVCDVLELNNVTQALTRLDDDEKNTIILNEGIGNPEKNIINESGLYSLILSSRKPQAKQFKKWVTNEVIPSIRKTGSYTNQPLSTLEVLQLATKEIEKLNQEKFKLTERNSDLTNVLVAYQKYGDSVLVREFVKIAYTEGKIEIKEREMWKFLRENKYLMYNDLPFAKYQHYFEVITRVFNDKIKTTTKITPKGINYFINKIVKMGQETMTIESN